MGYVELRQLKSYLKKDLSGKPTDSVRQWIISKTARIPKVDECFEIDGLTICVTQATPRAIRKVEIKPRQ